MTQKTSVSLEEPTRNSAVLRRELRLQRARQSHALVLQELCRLLHSQHVQRMQAKYAGAGGQGAIQQMVTQQNGQTTVSLPRAARRDLQRLCYGLLPPGWNAGEGSHGELQVDVVASLLIRRHWWRLRHEEADHDLIGV